MNVLETYTRNTTPMIEGLSLNNNEQLVPKLASTSYQNKTRGENTGDPIDLYKIWKSSSIPDFSLATSWQRYPLDLHQILNGTGTYIIQIRYGSVLYSGIVSYVDETSADIEDEIYLHSAGSFNRPDVTEGSEGRLYAKIALPSTQNEYPQLYLASSVAESNANSKISSIKFRKLI